MSTENLTETRRQKAGMWIAVICGPLFAEIYWQHKGSIEFLDQLPMLAAALISAAGCAVGGWLYGRTPQTRIAAMVSAALIGFGCNLTYQLMNGDKSRVTGGERWLAFGLGALPGLILGGLWIFRLEEKSKNNNPPAG